MLGRRLSPDRYFSTYGTQMDLEITHYLLRGWSSLACHMSCEEKSLRHRKYLTGLPAAVCTLPRGPIKE